jgi:beta-galactosidase
MPLSFLKRTGHLDKVARFTQWIAPACFTLLVASCSLPSSPTNKSSSLAPRPERPLMHDWRFHFGPVAGAEVVAFNDATWTPVSLPHTWNAQDGADGGNNYARGDGWYRTHFRSEPVWRGRQVFLQFDAASRSATVFLNGRQIGEHTGGFARFRFDITAALAAAGDNVLAVKVSNAPDDAPPISADFTFFGGLYRGVKIFTVDPLHVDTMDHASDGVYVTQRAVSREKAEFAVRVRVRNDSSKPESVTLRTEILDAAGTPATTRDEVSPVAAHGETTVEPVFTLATPHLWNGIQDPYRYTVRVSVLANGAVRDVVSTRIGLRSFAIDPDRGFFLNGEHLDLHGVCRHQDRAGKGWAIGEAEDREDFAMIKEMGANAIRVAHYPQSDLWFDLADENGLILWAEIPVVNEVPASEHYAENARQQLRELIRQHYNHPAIVVWGVGNETREMGETSGREKPNAPTADRLIGELAQLARAEDDTRLSVYASHHRPDDIRNFHTDVLAFNKYFGWYGGNSNEFAAWADDVHRRFPTLRFGISEYGAGANPQQHEVSPKRPTPAGVWHPEEYQALCHEIQWSAMRARPYLWAKFIWNMFDFAADQRGEGGAPGMNDKGLVTYDRKTRKDAFYWYQANWSSAPMVHLTSRRFADRNEAATEVKVYSNAPQVELLLNGVSRGVVASNDHIFRWQVDLAEGANRLTARAVGLASLTDECTWTYLKKDKP